MERSAAQCFLGTPMAWVATGPTLPAPVLEAAISRGHLWVAEAGGVIGFLLASRLDDDLFIEEVSVALPHQGRGFGRALLMRAVARAGDEGLSGISLTTDRELPWNAPFYARLGFRPLAEEALTSSLRQRLLTEASHGHDASRRCAMRLPLPAGNVSRGSRELSA